MKTLHVWWSNQIETLSSYKGIYCKKIEKHYLITDLQITSIYIFMPNIPFTDLRWICQKRKISNRQQFHDLCFRSEMSGCNSSSQWLCAGRIQPRGLLLVLLLSGWMVLWLRQINNLYRVPSRLQMSQQEYCANTVWIRRVQVKESRQRLKKCNWWIKIINGFLSKMTLKGIHFKTSG